MYFQLLNIVYPVESFFYPYHLIAAIVAGSIFGIIILVLFFKQMRGRAITKDAPKKLGPADAISLGTLILTLTASGLYPFIINPMLDYEVSYGQRENSNIQEYIIRGNQLGTQPRKKCHLLSKVQ